ncbi:hypothetical protein GA0070604_4069 [Micromonospora eburnea]|uniref:Uncharacterized protein n=1 Tax=Micromonospora eburnea TaxID=227316 RepID=A0A1C6UZQ2_9ACTN|nr:hypothetical protein GA0070604_4069 [Micromonospora eburnea]
MQSRQCRGVGSSGPPSAGPACRTGRRSMSVQPAHSRPRESLPSQRRFTTLRDSHWARASRIPCEFAGGAPVQPPVAGTTRPEARAPSPPEIALKSAVHRAIARSSGRFAYCRRFASSATGGDSPDRTPVSANSASGSHRHVRFADAEPPHAGAADPRAALRAASRAARSVRFGRRAAADITAADCSTTSRGSGQQNAQATGPVPAAMCRTAAHHDTISGARSGLRLDAYRPGTTNGTKIVLWTRHGGASQRWSLRR